ncbi:MAG: cell division protein FtsQ/DivIB [Leptospirales bacterium]|nr:cell division protein FtsQ/DivIB [Leptospirales bacterium]
MKLSWPEQGQIAAGGIDAAEAPGADLSAQQPEILPVAAPAQAPRWRLATMPRDQLLWIVLALLAALIIALGIFLLWRGELQSRAVRSIVVEGAGRFSSTEILALSTLRSGAPIDDQTIAAAEARLRLHPALLDVRIERRGEDLAIVVHERQCAALVKPGSEDALIFEIDPEGVILAENRLRCPDAPLLSGPFRRQGERFDDPQLKQLLADLSAVRSAYPDLARRISEIRLRPEGGAALYLSRSRVRVELPATFGDALTLGKLYAAVSYLERRGLQQGAIDLRGADAVISAGP